MFSEKTAQATSEEEIISRARKGDRDAFNDLVLLHHAGVHNVVYRMCGDARLAEDAAQAAFVRVWQHLPRYRPGTSFRSWLYRIAVNAALDMLRREKPTENIDDLALASSQHVEKNVLQRERQTIVRQAVLSLPAASRAVLVLREYEGLSYQEIAESLDIPIGTVMSRLNYARKTLQERLQPALEEV